MARSESCVDAESDGCVGDGADAATAVARAGIDAVAIKPASQRLARARELPVETIAVDYEGHDHLPDADVLRTLARERDVVVTTPVRADGFDPLGDDTLLREWLPDGVRRALVAGHPAYLGERERQKSIADRVGAALQATDDAWIGSEGIERVATATGATQYDLLTRDTERAVRALRAVGFEGDVAVYAPVVLTDDADAILDSVGSYVARRSVVDRALPADAAIGADATGRAREILLDAARDFALVGTEREVREQVADLRAAGVTTVVGYPARGIDEFL